jgi:tetratricopeptide (TPR) repeat protein
MGSQLRSTPVAASLALLLVLATTSLVTPRHAHAGEPPMKPEARALLDAGLGHYAAKDYEAAIAAFRRGYELDARAEFLFAWAQAERLSGDCASAIELYEMFIASGPPPEQSQGIG